MTNRWRQALIVAGSFGFLGLAMTVEVYFNQRSEMPNKAGLFGDLIISQMGRAVMWACLFPFVLQLRVKMPLSRGGWVGGVLFHAFSSVAIMAIYYPGRIASYRYLYHETWGDYWTDAVQGFYGHNLIDIAWYWGILAFGYSVETYERFRSEELKAAQLESRLIETELKALREQLRPHFLFNTMNTVAVLVRERRNDEAVTLLSKLGSLLRLSLDPARVHEVTLRQEMEFLEHYVDIQKARFSDRLTVAVDITAEAMAARIPNLLLQPLVENAIIHGAGPKDGPCLVRVTGRVERGVLELAVLDDGAGFCPGKSGGTGVGLANTRERLARIYGAAGQLTLQSEPGKGVCLFIRLPFTP